METYILMGLCLAAWGITVGAFKLFMRDSENAFVVGAMVGLVLAAVAGAAYYQYLATCRSCF